MKVETVNPGKDDIVMVTQNLLEIEYENKIVAKIDKDGNYTCYDKTNLVKALVSIYSTYKQMNNASE